MSNKTVRETTIIDRVLRTLEGLTPPAKLRVLGYVTANVEEEARGTPVPVSNTGLAGSRGNG